MRKHVLIIAFGVFCAFCGERLFAQKPDGYVSVGVDAVPNAPGAPAELRARLFADEKLTPFEHLTLRAAGSLDVLGFRKFVRDEFQFLPPANEEASTQTLKFVPNEFHAEITGARGDLRLGYSRIVWGRLDEVQPTDVVNPLDLARFFFEGRSEARLAVPMARGRLFFGERANIEAILVPQFRRGRFDLLAEETSPFNLEGGEKGTVTISAAEMGTVTVSEAPMAENPGVFARKTVTVPFFTPSAGAKNVTVPLIRREPAVTWRNVQGGGRVSATTGRVDWSASFFRGFDAFGTYVPAGVAVVQVFPWYTMIGGDFETTKGEWALRGEVARFSGEPGAVDGGVGFDRRAGEFHVSGTVLVHHEGAIACDSPNAACAVTGPIEAYTATSIVAAADRSFARERYRTRTFTVYNTTERATFLRNITSMELRPNVVVEGSIGWFFGTGSSRAQRDVIGRFSDRDFLYARLRVHF